MAPRTNRRSLIFWTFALLACLTGTAAKADPIYNVTNLGSGMVNLATASGSTILVSTEALPTYSIATNQLTSVSNGQVSYSFATTPDTPLIQGQGPLSSIPLGLGTSAPSYGSPEVSGFQNVDGFTALVVTQPLNANPNFSYNTAYAVPQNSNGTLAWDHGATVASGPANTFTPGYIMIAGVNAANQALVGTSFGTMPYDAIVYNLGTNSRTDLDTLPAITSGSYNNLKPIAIDDQGQILVNATAVTPGGLVSDVLLLTPGSTPPDPFATPEPGSCVLWTVIACASFVAAKRARFTR